MAKDQYGYPCDPQKIDEVSWFYELRNGLYIENHQFPGARRTIVIPWRKLEAAVDRHRAIRAARKKHSK